MRFQEIQKLFPGMVYTQITHRNLGVQRKQEAQDKIGYWDEQVADLIDVLTKVMELLEPGSSIPVVHNEECDHAPAQTSASLTSSPSTNPGVTTNMPSQPPYTRQGHLHLQPFNQFLSSVLHTHTQAQYSTPLFPSNPTFHPNPYGLVNTHVSFPSPNSVPVTTIFGPNAPGFSHHQILFLQQYLSSALGATGMPPTAVSQVGGRPLLQAYAGGPQVSAATIPLHESTPTSSSSPFDFPAYSEPQVPQPVAPAPGSVRPTASVANNSPQDLEAARQAYRRQRAFNARAGIEKEISSDISSVRVAIDAAGSGYMAMAQFQHLSEKCDKILFRVRSQYGPTLDALVDLEPYNWQKYEHESKTLEDSWRLEIGSVSVERSSGSGGTERSGR